MRITGFEYYPSGALIEHGALLFRYRATMGHYLSMGHNLSMGHYSRKYGIPQNQHCSTHGCLGDNRHEQLVVVW